MKINRELAKTNPAFLTDLALSLNNLGAFQRELGQPDMARSTYLESIEIIRPLAASNQVFQEYLQRTLNNLEQLNRNENAANVASLDAGDTRYLPANDPTTPVKRAVVRLLTMFTKNNARFGPSVSTGFVVRRQGDRAWIVTALHVLREPDGGIAATDVQAELFTGPLPAGVGPPKLEVLLDPRSLPDSGDEPILLEVRGLPPDVQPLPLANTPAPGMLINVFHPSQPVPWTVVRYRLAASSEEALLLEGGLPSGASGAPVLNTSQQVVGVVYDSPDVSKSRPIALTWAFPIKALAEKMK